MTIYI